ncbi:MAG: hypothetical protein D6722_25805 [Bacteroidetes bacterium]|nr:MAG: hypothetical protein D6722_25805 [Bacteroidota bacterium]
MRLPHPLTLIRTILLFGFMLSQQLAWSQYVTNGSAFQVGNCFQLTQAVNFQSGSVWYLDMVDISEPFELYMDIFLGCKDADGADGMAFVMQQVSTSVGSAGEGIGYQGIQPSLAVEFDTWQNTNRNDPAFDHMSLMVDGVVTHGTANELVGPLQILPGVNNIEDCQDHALRVSWNPDSMIFRLYVDCFLRVEYTGDLVNNIFGGTPTVFWGFTSATGGFNNVHRFCLDYISFTEDLQDAAICEGESVQLFVGSGDTFSWSPTTGLSDPTVADPVASPLVTTTYVATITDVCGQQRQDTVTIVVQDSLDTFLPNPWQLCNGEVLIDATTPFGSYLWPDSSIAPTFLATQPGTYPVAIGNACNVVQDSAIVIPQPEASLSSNDVSCNGTATGSATVTYNTGLPPYTFLWRDAGGNLLQTATTSNPANSLNNIPAGTYTVVVFDADGCADTLSTIISEPPPLVGSLVSQSYITCGGTPTGSFTLQATGGTPPYAYSSGGGFQGSPTLTGLTAGTYQAQVRDANGCRDTITVILQENVPLAVSLVSQTNILCNGDATGALSVSAAGGSAPYTYALDGTTFVPLPSFGGLTAGTYTVTVQDDSACTQTLNVQLTQPPALGFSVDAQQNVDCNGNNSGSFSISGTGGVAGYSFSFDGGPYGLTASWDSLTAGSYPIQVQDSNGCLFSAPVTITEPTPLGTSLLDITMIDCNGNSSGSFTMGGTGGTAPYVFSLDGNSFQPAGTFDSLPAGSYQVTIMDDSSCVVDTTLTLTEPSPVAIAVTDRIDVDCLGNASGVLSVAGSGGTPGYVYNLNGGAWQASGTFNELFAGFYTLAVRDSNLCTTSVDTIIATPTDLVGGIDTLVDVACNGDSTGYFTLRAQGGTAPYSYTYDFVTYSFATLYDSLPAQTDTIILEDANGCIVPIPYTISEPPPLSGLVAEQAHVACNGDSTAWLRLSASGGNDPYTFSVDGISFQPDSLFTGLPAGIYPLVIQDSNGCTFGFTTTITEPPLLQAEIADQRNVDCFGNNTGAVSIQATGGTLPYRFQLDTLPADTITFFDGFVAGSYSVSVADDSGCVVTVPIQITEPDSLTLAVDSLLHIACFGDATGFIDLQAQGGTLPYAFTQDSLNFQSDSLFAALAAGSYSLWVTDDSGCVARLDTQLTEPPAIDMGLATQVDVRCFGEDNGQLSASASGGVAPYLFDLNQGLPQPDSLFANLGPGTYTLRLTDQNGCQDSLTELTILEPDLLTVEATVDDVNCFGGGDGSIWATGAGGTQPYAYVWSTEPPQTDSVATGLPAGSYTLLLTDANGCDTSLTATVNEPELLVLEEVGVTDAFCDWANGDAEVLATGGTQPYTFLWEGVPGLTGPVANDIFGARTYLVQVTDILGCTDTLTVFVDNTPPAVPSFRMDPPVGDSILFSSSPIRFFNESEGAVAYRWDLGVSGRVSDDESPLFDYPEPGTYTVTLTAYNSFLVCPADYSLTFTLIPDGQLFVPNAFSPNGDGHNDQFRVGGEGVQQMELRIYSRWGRELAILNSLEDGWDGRSYQGTAMPEGVYTYVVRATLNNGAQIERGGTITLFR